MSSIERVRAVVGRASRIRLAVVFGSTVRHGTRQPEDVDVGVSLMPGEGPALADLVDADERIVFLLTTDDRKDACR